MTTEYVVTVPDIGTSAAVEVIEILVKPGDEVTEGMSLITLESDKASMEIPAPQAGIVKALQVTLGKKIMQGDVILTLESAAAEASVKTPESVVVPIAAPTTPATPEPTNVVALKEVPTSESDTSTDLIFAGPAVRRLARELGVELSVIPGTGQKQRITSEDVHRYVKQALQNRGSSMVSAAPVIDFSQFGSVEFTPLHKIKRLTAAQVHRSWVSIPHVTQFDEADVTDLDAFRKSENAHAEKAGYKLTMLAFVTKAVVRALMEYPSFNASLDASGEQLILKHYYNIGIAVETPQGLVVPVIRDVHQKTVSQIAQEMSRLSQKARDKGLSPADMSGGCFTISSLGGIGGTAFTPIVNSPEVAILGLSRTMLKPVYDAATQQWCPRLMLPLSLSYDHRVIDGAEGARFAGLLTALLSDFRRVML